MTICPIALAVGCEKCPAFKFCPLTTVLGDQEKKDEKDEKEDSEKEYPLTEIMVTIQQVVYMVVCCCACFGVLFLLFSFMAKQMAKQKEKITFVRSLISLIAESLKKSNH